LFGIQSHPAPEALFDFAQESITGEGDPRSMVQVRLTGTEVTEGFPIT